MFKKKEKPSTEPTVDTELTEVDDESSTKAISEKPEDTKVASVSTDKDKKDEKPVKKDDEPVVCKTGPELGKLLTGNFKVYRGRNINTITALANAVIVDGEYVEENGLLWLPVRFNNKTGTESKGYIFHAKEF